MVRVVMWCVLAAPLALLAAARPVSAASTCECTLGSFGSRRRGHCTTASSVAARPDDDHSSWCDVCVILDLLIDLVDLLLLLLVAADVCNDNHGVSFRVAQAADFSAALCAKMRQETLTG